MLDLSFYRGKKVLITGHTGFKGSWLCRILTGAGAEVTGYSLEPPTDPNLFSLAGLSDSMRSLTGDVRDFESLRRVFTETAPEIVFHLAAQPIVLLSYREPRLTYETNVMGTVNLLECVRMQTTVRSVLNVTTDKVYHNNEWPWGYRETDPLDGFDPYSNSKSCSELVTHSYVSSFFSGSEAPAVSTARAGNVIGGGDFAPDRIIPDCVRAVREGVPVEVRNPYSTRPFQHVLEPLFAYLLIAKEQYDHPERKGWYNVGPDDCDCVSAGKLVGLFCDEWGKGASWVDRMQPGAPHEASFLKLDCSRIRSELGWKPRWHISEAVRETVSWTKVWMDGGSIPSEMDREINAFREEKES